MINVCNQLANDGKRVIVAGLDMDYRGVPFEPMPQILSVAEYITKPLAICVECGNPADRTQRKTTSSERVIVGAADVYEARCRKCHYIPTEENTIMNFESFIRGIFGLVLLIGIAFLLSNNKKKISWRLVFSGLDLQFIFALFIFNGENLRSYFFPLGWPIDFFNWAKL